MNEKAKYWKTFILKLSLFQAIIVKLHRLLRPAHIVFLILLLSLHIFLPASIFAECIYGNCTNGQGTFTWPNGQKYVGEFKDSKADGQGIYSWPNGQKYVGEFKDSKADGQGIYTWPNGQKYVGEFKDDKSNGQGTYTWPNGQKYVGEFRDDKFNGQGTITYTDGSKYEGEFKDGNPNGQGNGTYPDRGRNVAEFTDDKPAVNRTLTTPVNWSAILSGSLFLILVTLIFLWYRNTANDNQKDKSGSASGFSSKKENGTSEPGKINQRKGIDQNGNVFKEAGMINDSAGQPLENDAEISRCYEVLQLRPGVSKEELRGAYKNLLLVWDAHKRAHYPTLQKKAQEKITEIDEAYEKLLLHMAAENSAAKQGPSDLKASTTTPRE